MWQLGRFQSLICSYCIVGMCSYIRKVAESIVKFIYQEYDVGNFFRR